MSHEELIKVSRVPGTKNFSVDPEPNSSDEESELAIRLEQCYNLLIGIKDPYEWLDWLKQGANNYVNLRKAVTEEIKQQTIKACIEIVKRWAEFHRDQAEKESHNHYKVVELDKARLADSIAVLLGNLE